jgi:hypothetical protein
VSAACGTSWHSIVENDGFRGAYLRDVARAAGRRFTPVPGVSFAGRASADAGDGLEASLRAIVANLRQLGRPTHVEGRARRGVAFECAAVGLIGERPAPDASSWRVRRRLPALRGHGGLVAIDT